MTFLSLSLYVGIITASTTDEMLVKATTVTLPFFNVPISIVGFYALAPWLVVLHHGYVIVYFKALAQKLQRFRDGIAALPLQERAVCCERLITLPYVHFFAYPEKAGTGEWLSVYVPLGITPAILAVWLQSRFIAYRDMWPATALQVFAVIVEVGLLFWWLPRILRHHLNDSGLSQLKVRRGAKLFRTFGILGLVIAAVLLELRFAPDTSGAEFTWRKPGVLDLRGVMLTQNTPTPEVLNQLKADEAQQDEALKHISGFYLQGKDLRGAILYEAVLSRVDLRAKRVSGLMDFLVCTHRVPADQNEIRCRSLLDGADLRWAYLQYAWLNEASLNHAKLDNSRLLGADLSGAQLQEAELQNAQLQGAHLQNAVLFDAKATRANFCKADLRGVNLQGADLSYANFTCANLAGAKLEGAHLQYANFKGARGATFDPAGDTPPDRVLDLVNSPEYNVFCGEEVDYRPCKEGK
jgi:uncharacterized protein YjbI with pentapeptide repeats